MVVFRNKDTAQTVADLGGGWGGCIPPHQRKHNVHMNNTWLILKKQSVNTWIVVSSCDCDKISKAKGRGGGGERKKYLRSEVFTKQKLVFYTSDWFEGTKSAKLTTCTFQR